MNKISTLQMKECWLNFHLVLLAAINTPA